jgi:23S rRNA (pseudouridine1915-N3)-methyltransferase
MATGAQRKEGAEGASSDDDRRPAAVRALLPAPPASRGAVPVGGAPCGDAVRVTIAAVGRLKGGPEASLVGDYLARFDRTGRALGLGPARVIEVEDRRGGGPAAEGALLAAAVPEGALLVALDERGDALDSPGLADFLRRTADAGHRDIAFAIGGADGLAPALRDRADRRLTFGRMVWPHMLVRVMLAEQLYRAASILAGSPYHRGG